MCALSMLLGVVGCGKSEVEKEGKLSKETADLFQKFNTTVYTYKGMQRTPNNYGAELEFDADGDNVADAVLSVRMYGAEYHDDINVRTQVWGIPKGAQITGKDIRLIGRESNRLLYLKRENEADLRKKFAFIKLNASDGK